jgi:putative polyhydroxyalkanoate system protein
MSDIDIRISHAIPLGRARKQAERVAMQLKERFALDYAWSENTLKFSRQGVAGALNVTPTEVAVRVRLGLLFSFLKPQIEKQIRHQLSKVFGPSPVAVAKPTVVKRAPSTKAVRSPKSLTASRRKS